MNKKKGGKKSGTIKGRGVYIYICIICGTQLRQPIFHVITAIPAIRLSNSRDKIRFGCFTIEPRCGIAIPFPPNSRNERLFPHGEKSPQPLLSPPTYNRPDFYIWSTFVSDSRKWPANGTGPTGSPRFRAGQINIFAIKHSAGS